MDAQTAAASVYDVFISYSMDPDYALSRRVESFLEGFHTLKLPEGQELKHLQVCRDGSDFSMHKIKGESTARAQGEDSVTQVLVEYLARSNYLLVLCSPNAAKSRYVSFEVDWFIRHKGADKVLVAVTEGANLGGNIDYLFPQPALDNQLHQRIFYDLRGSKSQSKNWLKVRDYEEELTKLAAHLNDRTPGEILPTWRQEEKRKLRRQRYVAGVVAGVLLLLSAGVCFQWYRANKNEQEARNQRATAHNQLARNYWSSGKYALNGNNALKYVQLVGQGVVTSEDSALTKDLLQDVQPILPQYQLEAVLGLDVGEASFSPNGHLVAAFSQDSRLLVGWNARGVVQVRQAATGQPLGRPVTHRGAVNGAVFSRDGSRVLSWGDDGMRLWAATTGKLLAPPMPTEAGLAGAFFSPGERCIIAYCNGGIQRWQVRDGQAVGPLLQHPGGIQGIAWSQDTTRALTWGAHNVRLWDVAAGRLIGKPMGHSGEPLKGAALSPDKQRVVSWDFHGTVRQWQVATGQSIGKPLKHEGGAYSTVNGAVFSKHGDLILSWGTDGARLWQTATGQLLVGPLKDESEPSGAVLSPTERHILTWGTTGIRVWETASGQPLGRPMTHEGGIYGAAQGAAFSRDGSRILSWGGDDVRVWEAITGQPLTTALKHEGRVEMALYSPNEQRILSWGPGGTRLWRAAGAGTALLRHTGPVTGVAFSRDEQRLLSCGLDSTIRMWQGVTGHSLAPPIKHGSGVLGAVFSPTERRILSWGEDGTLRVWDAATRQPIGQPMRHGESLTGARFGAGEQRILSWGGDTVRLWAVATGLPIGPPIYANAAAFNRAGNLLLSWGDDGAVRLRRAADGQPMGMPMVHERGASGNMANGAAFSRNEKRILSWGQDGIRLWETATGQPLGKVMRQYGGVYKALFIHDEQQVLALGSAGMMQLWQVSTRQPVGRPMKHELARYKNGGVFESVGGAVCSRNEQRILSWGTDGVRLWRTADGQPLLPLLRHDGPVCGAAFSRDERRILSWGQDGTVRLWQTATGQPLSLPMAYEGSISGAAFSRDEHRLLSWGQDGIIRLRDVQMDYDLPPRLFPLEIQALTGADFNENTLEPYCLSANQWQSVRKTYNNAAAAHYQKCRYKAANQWARFRKPLPSTRSNPF